MRAGATSAAAAAVLAVALALVTPVASAAGTSTANPNACKVLTRTEIRRVVAEPVHRSDRTQQTPKRASICNWDVGTADDGALVSVWVQRGPAAREGYDVSDRVFGLAGEPVAALGDQAFWSSESGAVYVLRGSEFLYVQRLDPAGDTTDELRREQAVELADRALERL